jgi:hypothetical protein
VPRGKGGTALHPHIARDDGGAVGLVQKGNGAIGVKLTQLEIRRIKDMAIVVVIGIRGSVRKPHAETVQRWVDARATNKMPAMIADGSIPGHRRRGMRIKAVAVIEDATQQQRAILKAAPIAKGAQPNGEPGHESQIKQRRIQVARQDAEDLFPDPDDLHDPLGDPKEKPGWY